MTEGATTLEAADINELLKVLPHRYPFLLVDRIIAMRGDESAWIVPAEPNRAELAVDTAANTQIKLVFANCMTATVRAQSRFTVYEVTYGIVQAASNAAR